MNKFVITSISVDDPGAGQVTIVGSYSDVSVSTAVAQQVTIGNFPSGNPNWSRANRLTTDNLIISRGGVGSVALELASLNALASALLPGLTFAPVLTTSPTDDSCVASSTSAEFTAAFGSELALTYQWKVSTDGVSYSNVSDGGVYAGATTATLTITPTDTTLNGRYYKCTATNSRGSTDSGAAILTVTA
jgi:hypothetical protein